MTVQMLGYTAAYDQDDWRSLSCTLDSFPLEDLGVDVRNPLLDLLGPQTQGRHAALKIQVS